MKIFEKSVGTCKSCCVSFLSNDKTVQSEFYAASCRIHLGPGRI